MARRLLSGSPVVRRATGTNLMSIQKYALECDEARWARRMSNGAVKIGRLRIWLVLGLALLLRTLLPIAGYLYTRDVTIFYTPDTASYIVPAHELIVYHRFFSDGSPQ